MSEGIEKTLVEYFAEHEAYSCGYCGSSNTNYSHGMWAHAMNVEDYEALLNRGWRRSGKYVYKPTMNVTCCPMYPIRCEVLNFQMRRSHKKVIKRVNKYLIDGIKPSDNDKDDQASKRKQDPSKEEKPGPSVKTKPGPSADANPGPSVEAKPGPSAEAKPGPSVEAKIVKHVPKPGVGPDPSKPNQKKAKEIRKEKKSAKLAARGLDPESMDKGDHPEASKTLEDLLTEPDKALKPAHKLEVRLVRSSPPCQQFEWSLQESHNVYHRYQIKIHGDSPDKPSLKQYMRFLVDSPLQEHHKPTEGKLPMGYGSFHQQYILDGKIICVGVIDILPTCVSSKYLYYDPDYQFLSLGTYSALREIAFIRDLHHQCPDMLYYYMGYYIQNCPKMKYKGQYFPSFICCPETYTWHPVEKCSPILDAKKYSRFADATEEDKEKDIAVDDVSVLYGNHLLSYGSYTSIKRHAKQPIKDEQEVKEYAGFVGKTCAKRMFLFRK